MITLVLLAAAMVIPTNSESEITKKGNAYFAHIGTIAAPAYYHTIAVTLSFSDFIDRFEELQGVKKDTMAAFNKSISTLRINDADLTFKRVLRRTQRSEDRLGEAHQHLMTLIAFTVRKKRFLGMLLGFSGAIIAVGSAIYQANQVTKLANSIGRVDHRVSMVVASQRLLEDAIKQALDVEKAEIMEERLIYEINEVYDHSAEMMERLIEGIYAVRNHRLHPTVLPPSDMVEITKRIDKTKKTTGHSTVFEPKSHLEDYPISYVLKERGLIILLHVPFVTDGQQMVRRLDHLPAAKFQSNTDFYEF